MVEIFLQAPLELRIIIGGCLISGAWFMYREYRAEQKRKERHQIFVKSDQMFRNLTMNHTRKLVKRNWKFRY